MLLAEEKLRRPPDRLRIVGHVCAKRLVVLNRLVVLLRGVLQGGGAVSDRCLLVRLHGWRCDLKQPIEIGRRVAPGALSPWWMQSG